MKTTEIEMAEGDKSKRKRLRNESEVEGGSVAGAPADYDKEKPAGAAQSKGKCKLTSPEGKELEEVNLKEDSKKYEIITQDGCHFEYQEYMYHESQTLRLYSDEMYELKEDLHITSLDGYAFSKVDKYWRQHAVKRDESVWLDFEFNFARDLGDNQRKMVDVLNAANYLGSDHLVTLLCQEVAHMISSSNVTGKEAAPADDDDKDPFNAEGDNDGEEKPIPLLTAYQEDTLSSITVPPSCISIFLRGDVLLKLWRQVPGWEESVTSEPDFIQRQSKYTTIGFLNWTYVEDVGLKLPLFVYGSQRQRTGEIIVMPIELPGSMNITSPQICGSSNGILLLECNHDGQQRLAIGNANLGSWVHLPPTPFALQKCAFGLNVSPTETDNFEVALLIMKRDGCYFSIFSSTSNHWVESPNRLPQYGFKNYDDVWDVPAYVGKRFYWQLSFRKPKCVWFEPHTLLSGEIQFPKRISVSSLVDFEGSLGWLRLTGMTEIEIFKLQNGTWLLSQTVRLSLTDENIGGEKCNHGDVQILGILDKLLYIRVHKMCFCFDISRDYYLVLDHKTEIDKNATIWYPHKSTLLGCPKLASSSKTPPQVGDTDSEEGNTDLENDAQ